MRIANPLYDHAFKYLMSNNTLAKKVLATILDQQVIDLELSQQEIVVNNEDKRFTLFRLDFQATIVDDQGKAQKVLLELQKSKLPTNLLRFHNYLGHSYTSKKEGGALNENMLPIISIYILGYNLPDLEVMGALVDRQVINSSTKEVIVVESDFINLLTHKCYILQVRRLPDTRRTRLEKFMSLFNQAWISDEKYILDLEETPEEFQDIANFLQRPLLDRTMLKKLQIESEFELYLANQEAELAMAKQEAENAKLKAQQKVEEAQLKAQQEVEEAQLKAQQEVEEAQLKAQQEVEEAQLKAEKLVAQQQILIKNMAEVGMDITAIAQLSGLNEEEIKKLIA